MIRIVRAFGVPLRKDFTSEEQTRYIIYIGLFFTSLSLLACVIGNTNSTYT